MNPTLAPTAPAHPKPSAIRTRLATESDLPGLVEIVNAAYGVESFLEGTRTDLDHLTMMYHRGTLLVAEEETEPPAVIGCIYTELRGDHGYLGLMAVDLAQQGRGLARILMSAGEDLLRAQGCVAADISVLSLRQDLMPFYRRYGFRETGTEEFNFPRELKAGVECHCILMSKAL
jgi:ribosomal protein S18 acetylase RimI-like enzyme